MHPSVVGTLEHKEQWFKDLYNQFLNLPDDTLGKLNKFYADAVDTDFDSAINEYNRLVTAEYNKLGVHFFSILMFLFFHSSFLSFYLS